MRAVDTNVLVRLLTRDDARQTRAADEFVRAGAWISHLVLVETLWVLDSVYGLTHDRLSLAVEMLLDHESLTIQDADVVVAALSEYRARPAIGFSDCMILGVARKAGHLPLATFDKSLANLSGVDKLS